MNNTDSSQLIHLQCKSDILSVQTKIEDFLKNKNIQIFSIIDHAANAASVQLKQDPAIVIIFGNPAGGTPLMQAYPFTALILPLKMLISQNSQGETWLTYHNMSQLVQSCGADQTHPAVSNMDRLLDNLAKHASS